MQQLQAGCMAMFGRSFTELFAQKKIGSDGKGTRNYPFCINGRLAETCGELLRRCHTDWLSRWPFPLLTELARSCFLVFYENVDVVFQQDITRLQQTVLSSFYSQ